MMTTRIQEKSERLSQLEDKVANLADSILSIKNSQQAAEEKNQERYDEIKLMITQAFKENEFATEEFSVQNPVSQENLVFQETATFQEDFTGQIPAHHDTNSSGGRMRVHEARWPQEQPLPSGRIDWAADGRPAARERGPQPAASARGPGGPAVGYFPMVDHRFPEEIARGQQPIQQGKAGEDSVDVVLSEEQGWLFVGIYDGFSGRDGPSFLMSNLYREIDKELKGSLWDYEEESQRDPPAGNPNLTAREFPGAALLSYVFTPKELQGISIGVPRIHAAFEKALMEIAESLPLSRNIFIALLVLESWKEFIRQWTTAMATSADVKGSSIELDNGLKSTDDIFKICCKVAEEAVPQVSINAALAICALCLVVPSSSYALIFSASEFLLKWLFDYEHKHRQWSSAISLGLISNYSHSRDRKQMINVITCLMKVACNSNSHLVIRACGVGVGFACQSLLSFVEVDSKKLTEANLLRDVIRTLSMELIKLCPQASDSLKKLIESFLLDGYDSKEASSLLPQCKPDNLEEEDTWGIAGLVLGLGNSVVAIYRLGVNDAVLIIKDTLLSWVPSLESCKGYQACKAVMEDRDCFVLMPIGAGSKAGLFIEGKGNVMPPHNSRDMGKYYARWRRKDQVNRAEPAGSAPITH